MALVPFPNQASSPARPEDDPDQDTWLDRDAETGGKMSFLEHLDELRKRIIWSLLALGVGFVICFTFIDPIFDFVMAPMAAALPKGSSLVFTEPTEQFALFIQIAAIAGLLVASPVVMSQVWLFVAPGLYQHEKKLAIPFVILTSVCFIGGAAFSHYVVFPLMWAFFINWTRDYVTFLPRVGPAFSLYLKLTIAFGLIFQMPVLVLFLARVGVVTARFLWRHLKYAILIIFIASAVITPSADPFNQTVVALPMIGLYLLSIVLAWLFGKKRQIEEPEEA